MQHRDIPCASRRRRGARHDARLADNSLRLPADRARKPGDFFDGTEIDELLALRILTLTDQEKREMRDGDERARRILERTEAMSAERLMKLHGAAQCLRPEAMSDR